jgi:hypothetical protein
VEISLNIYLTGIGRHPAIEDYCTTQLFFHTPFYGQKMSLQKSEKMKKPEIIQDYNKFMRGMERADQILHCYPCCRKTMNGQRILFSFYYTWLL